MRLEQAIACSRGDELVEVTPKVTQIRKRYVDPQERKRASRKAEAGLKSASADQNGRMMAGADEDEYAPPAAPLTR